MTHPLLAQAPYLGTTESELAGYSTGRRILAALDQRALFPHRGTATLHPDRLVLSGWDGGDITLHPAQITDIANTFTAVYGRFLGGGVKKWGAPLVVTPDRGPALYLLLDHRWFSERTDNAAWAERLGSWWRAARR